MVQSFIYTRPFTYELKGTGDGEELILNIDVSSNDLDLVNDICSENCLKSMQEQIKNGNVKFDLEHEAFRGSSNEEKELNKTRIPVGRMENPQLVERIRPDGFKAKALNVKGIMNKVEDRYIKTKSNIVNRFLDAASIAFIPTKARTIIKDKKNIRILEDVKLLNVALTGNPVNTAAQMQEIVAKSLDAMEEYKNAKRLNPELENLLEVKDLKESGSDKEKRKLRKEAVSEGENEEEENKKKPEKKSYEKDGAHAHTENEPLGLHNHPEIENRIKEEISYLHNRINRLEEGIDNNLQEVEEIKGIETKPFAGYDNFAECVRKNKDKKDPKAYCATIQRQVEGKSNSNEIKELKKEEENMTDKIVNNETEQQVDAPVVSNETNEVLNEIKSMLSKQSEEIKSLNKEVKDLKELKGSEIVAPASDVNSKAIMSNENTMNVKTESKSVAGLCELR